MVVVKGIAMVAGAALIAAAFLQWITFSYPEGNPMMPGFISTTGLTGALATVANWLIVCALGAVGIMLIQWARRKKS